MSKREFLQKLGEYLSYELPDRYVEKNLDYYSGYINDEVQKGRTQDEVLNELGDPQLIARTIIDAAKSGSDGVPNTGDDVDFTGEVYGNAGSYGTGGSYGNSSYNGGGTGGRVYGEDGAESGYAGRNADNGGNNIHVYSGGCFTIILICLAVFCLFSVLGTVLGLLSPIIAPVCIVLLILWLLERRR